MPRLTRGGREISEHLLADLAATEGAAFTLAAQITEILDGLPLKLIKFNPDFVAQELATMRLLVASANQEHGAAIDRIRRRIREDLEEMLQRQEKLAEQASIPDRVAELERRLAELEGQGRIIPLRREGS